MGDRDVNRDYTFLSLLGQGSFGKVHKVQHRQTGAIYACKEIDYSNMKEKEKELLVHEVNTMKDMDHVNVVKYVDRYLDKGRGRLYMIQEYCDNGDLARYIKRHKSERRYIAEEKVWAVAQQLLSVMDYCHNRAKAGAKILHRDIKPGNVFLTKDGSIKVGDFGLCRQLDDNQYAKTNVGTPLYMPPEILQKQSYTEKADLWSVGCVIYELAVLQPPFVATNIESLKAKVKQGVRPALPAQYSQDLRNLIDQLLAMQPAARPDSSVLLQLPRFAEFRAPQSAPAVHGNVNNANNINNNNNIPNLNANQTPLQPGETLEDLNERLNKREYELGLRQQKLDRALAEIRRKEGRGFA